MRNYLFAFDFDGTIARTFEPSPSGIGVNEAYARAIFDVFGQEGLDTYRSLGGLGNRAPQELVALLLDKARHIAGNAYGFFSKNRDSLSGLVLNDESVSLVWNYNNSVSDITELLVRQKLVYLLDQIGTKFPDGQVWPRPCGSFVDFWSTAHKLQEQGINLVTAIISSGHQAFIEKTFKKWGLVGPNILVTDDDIRSRQYPREPERKIKPGLFPFALAHHKWLRMQADALSVEEVKKSRSNIIYFGDDFKRDKEMARNAGVVFGWFTENGSNINGYGGDDFTFGNWAYVSSILSKNQQLMKEGRPVCEIFESHTGSERQVLASIPEIAGFRSKERI